MLKHLIKAHKYPIGIDIGAYAVRMVQLEERAGSAVVAASSVQVLDPGLPANGPAREKCIVQAIRLGLAEADFKGNRVVTAIAASDVVYKNIRIPIMPANELKMAVTWEASDRLHLSSDEVHVQYLNAGEVRQGDDNKQEIIVLAAKKKAINEHLELLAQCQLMPIAVEAAPSALARWANYHQPKESNGSVAEGGSGDSGASGGGAVVVLDLGYHSSKILICHHGRVLFYKQIESAGQQINEYLAEKLQMSVSDIDQARLKLTEHDHRTQLGDTTSPIKSSDQSLQRTLNESLRLIADELTRELSLCLRYYSVTFRGHRPERACVTGGMSREPRFLEIIQEKSGMTLNVAPLLDNQELQSQSFLASGLAMRLPGRVIQGRQAA